MREDTPRPLTTVLQAAAAGDRDAASAVLPMVYDELRALARARLAKMGPGQTLHPTGLVHEAYLRLVGKEDPGWEGRGHFFGAAAQAMRDILVEEARRKASLKRGGDRQRVALEHAEPTFEPPSDEVLAVDEALRRLEPEDARKGQIVNLRYFVGLTNEETASALGVSVTTVEREWRYIRAWLRTELAGRAEDGSPGPS